MYKQCLYFALVSYLLESRQIRVGVCALTLNSVISQLSGPDCHLLVSSQNSKAICEWCVSRNTFIF